MTSASAHDHTKYTQKNTKKPQGVQSILNASRGHGSLFASRWKQTPPPRPQRQPAIPPPRQQAAIGYLWKTGLMPSIQDEQATTAGRNRRGVVGACSREHSGPPPLSLPRAVEPQTDERDAETANVEAEQQPSLLDRLSMSAVDGRRLGAIQGSTCMREEAGRVICNCILHVGTFINSTVSMYENKIKQECDLRAIRSTPDTWVPETTYKAKACTNVALPRVRRFPPPRLLAPTSLAVAFLILVEETSVSIGGWCVSTPARTFSVSFLTPNPAPGSRAVS